MYALIKRLPRETRISPNATRRRRKKIDKHASGMREQPLGRPISFVRSHASRPPKRREERHSRNARMKQHLRKELPAKMKLEMFIKMKQQNAGHLGPSER